MLGKKNTMPWISQKNFLLLKSELILYKIELKLELFGLGLLLQLQSLTTLAKDSFGFSELSIQMKKLFGFVVV